MPLRQLGNDYHAKQKAEAAATEISEVLALTQSDIFDLDKSKERNASQGNVVPLIELRKVHWSDAGRVRLSNLSAQIKAKDRVWLRGHSGVGKSSLMAILLGFEQHYQGQFLIEGELLTVNDLAAWRRRLAWLPQTPEWVQGTIRQNLELGLGHCTDDALRNALIKAQCWDFVGSLRFGWDTSISEAGTGLSGGQMQRLSIARALLSQADIWLLDEPCSSLDSETAEQVLNTLDEASYGKTVLIISHDTHPVIWANQQWLMTEEGVHVETQTPISYV